MKLPDGPTTPPFLQKYQWITCPLEFLETCAQRYGDPFTVRRNKFPSVYFSNPQAIQEIFTANPEVFASAGGSAVVQPLFGERSLILLDGKQHQRKRKLLMPPFHGDFMQTYGQLICNITQQVMSRWVISEPFLVCSSMQDISLRVILSAVFGLPEGQRFEQLRQLLISLLDYVGSPLGSSLLYFGFLQQNLGTWSPWGRLLRQKQHIDQFLYAEIAQRREQGELSRTDILSLLLAARDQAGQAMTDVELRDELMTLLFAGHETTAIALAWALYWIHLLPDVYNKLVRELDSLAPDSDPSTIARLPYLTAVCQETLRISPIATIGLPRLLRVPLQLMNAQFEPGTVVIPCIYLTHQRSDLYPEPKQFKPERFLESQFSPYEYLPFGGGNRSCIGQAFAQFEMKLVLATILSRLQLELTNSLPVRPIRRGPTMAPPDKMQMVVRHRQHQNTLVHFNQFTKISS